MKSITDLLELGDEAGEGLEALVDLEGGRVLAEELGQVELDLLQRGHVLFQALNLGRGVLEKELGSLTRCTVA